MTADGGLFYEYIKMATGVDVQYFSHLNGLTLGNNWGDLIRLLDTCLANGLPLTSITSASIDAQGDITLSLYAAHNCMLFQIIELTGFTNVSIDGVSRQVNGKYRIKGVPAANQLILKGIARTDANPTVVNLIGIGAAKLASLGYEIIFRDTNDVKRVYRAKNPRAEHPFIRVDETISDGANNYTSTFVKYAMVGLIENMTHIDDYADPTKLQLPLDITDFTKNWKINGTGNNVVRGWAKWYWASGAGIRNGGSVQNYPPPNGNRKFTICGDSDAFYLLTPWVVVDDSYKVLYGCGVYNNSLNADIVPPWFLFAPANINNAVTQDTPTKGKSPLLYGDNERKFIVPTYDVVTRIKNHVYCNPIMLDNYTGMPASPLTATSLAALEIPMYDENAMLRGALKHVCYAGNNLQAKIVTTPMIADNSMYVADSSLSYGNNLGGLYFYLGELE